MWHIMGATCQSCMRVQTIAMLRKCYSCTTHTQSIKKHCKGLAARPPVTHAAPISHVASKMSISSLQTLELIVQRQHSTAQHKMQLHTSLAAAWHAALPSLAAAGLAGQLTQPAVPSWLHCAPIWHALPLACAPACWLASQHACPSGLEHCASP